MKTHELGDRGRMPMLGLGTWKSEPGEVHAAIKEAIRIGYRHLDCAAIYNNEPEIGQALCECFQAGLVSRDDMWITSKLWNDSHAPGDVIPALQQTLADLKLDYLDLYLIHWPVALPNGMMFPAKPADLISLDELPIADTWAQLEAAVDQGLCRHIGVSNFSVVKLKSLVAAARIKPAVNQVELHPYLQQNDLVNYCRDNGIFVTAYSPLGSNDRPDRLRQADDPVLLRDPVITAIADKLGASPAQVLLGWAVQRGTSVIPKSVNPGRMAENLAAAELALDDEAMQQIARLDRHRRYISGESWVMEGSAYTLANLWDE